RKRPITLRQPDVRCVRTPQVYEVILAVAVEVSALPRARLHAVARPRLIGRDRKRPVTLRQPDVRCVRTPQVYEVILAVAVEVSALPRAHLHAVARPRLIGRDRKRPVTLRQPDVRCVRTPQVYEVALAVAVEVSALPRAHLHAVARPRLIGRYRKIGRTPRQQVVEFVQRPQVD